MNKVHSKSAVLLLLLSLTCCNAPGGNDNALILIKTTLGDIKLRLYDGTPVHRDNFIKLVNSGLYEGVSFHRVINSFMIQGGDLSTRSSRIPQSADSLNIYTLPAEFNTEYFHKKGALAAAREGNDANPEMRSSGTQFYIVQGTKLNDNELDQAEQRINNSLKQAIFNKFLKQVADSAHLTGTHISDGEIQEKASYMMFEYLTTNENYHIPESQRIVYKSLGGVPRLDATYTVFGEVIEGLDVVDRIAAVSTDNSDRPVSDIRIIKIKIADK